MKTTESSLTSLGLFPKKSLLPKLPSQLSSLEDIPPLSSVNKSPASDEDKHDDIADNKGQTHKLPQSKSTPPFNILNSINAVSMKPPKKSQSLSQRSVRFEMESDESISEDNIRLSYEDSENEIKEDDELFGFVNKFILDATDLGPALRDVPSDPLLLESEDVMSPIKEKQDTYDSGFKLKSDESVDNKMKTNKSEKLGTLSDLSFSSNKVVSPIKKSPQLENKKIKQLEIDLNIAHEEDKIRKESAKRLEQLKAKLQEEEDSFIEKEKIRLKVEREKILDEEKTKMSELINQLQTNLKTQHRKEENELRERMQEEHKRALKFLEQNILEENRQESDKLEKNLKLKNEFELDDLKKELAKSLEQMKVDQKAEHEKIVSELNEEYELLQVQIQQEHLRKKQELRNSAEFKETQEELSEIRRTIEEETQKLEILKIQHEKSKSLKQEAIHHEAHLESLKAIIKKEEQKLQELKLRKESLHEQIEKLGDNLGAGQKGLADLQDEMQIAQKEMERLEKQEQQSVYHSINNQIQFKAPEFNLNESNLTYRHFCNMLNSNNSLDSSLTKVPQKESTCLNNSEEQPQNTLYFEALLNKMEKLEKQFLNLETKVNEDSKIVLNSKESEIQCKECYKSPSITQYIPEPANADSSSSTCYQLKDELEFYKQRLNNLQIKQAQLMSQLNSVPTVHGDWENSVPSRPKTAWTQLAVSPLRSASSLPSLQDDVRTSRITSPFIQPSSVFRPQFQGSNTMLHQSKFEPLLTLSRSFSSSLALSRERARLERLDWQQKIAQMNDKLKKDHYEFLNAGEDSPMS